MRFLKSLALGLGAACLCGGAFAVESLSTPTGVHVWNKYGAYEGYTLLSPNMTNDVYLIDMKGDVVHTWHTAGKPGLYAELLPNIDGGHCSNPAMGLMKFYQFMNRNI